MGRPKAKAKENFRIKPYKHSKLKFVVRTKIHGKWERKFFSTKTDAETFVELKEVELLNQGKEGVQFSTSLRIMAQRAHDILIPFGKSISDAVDFYVKHLESTQKSSILEKAIEELIANRKATGASPRYCKDLDLRLGRFRKDFPSKMVSEVTTVDIDTWLAKLPLAPVTRNTFRRDLRTLFSFSSTRGYCSSNPVTNARKAKEVDGEIGILTVDQTTSLLKACEGDLLPYIALGAFAGLRSAELQRLTWDEIHFDSKLIEVKASKSKTARRRFVKLKPNLEKWLLPYKSNKGKISPMGLRTLELAARSRANIEEWPPNALRHSFASYHLGNFKNAAELALEMGHTNQQMIFDHYRQLVKPKEAAAYWKIFPTTST